jgi:hypothetical protein
MNNKHYPVFYLGRFVGTTGEGRDKIFQEIVNQKKAQSVQVKRMFLYLLFTLGILTLIAVL